MAGNKNSGRKSARYEKTKREVLDKAWAKIEKEIDKHKVTEVALPLALKDMATKHAGHDGKELPNKILVEFLDGKPTDNNTDS